MDTDKQLRIGLFTALAFAVFFGVMLVCFIIDRNVWMCVSMALMFIVSCSRSVRLYRKIKES